MLRAERQIVFWGTAALFVIATIALLKDILLPFIVGITIAYFLSPIVDRLVALGLNRVVASLLIVATGAVLVVVALVLLVPIIVAQAQQFATALPSEVERLEGLAEAWARERLGPGYENVQASISRAAATLSENWASLFGWAATSLWSQSLAVVNFLALMLVTPLVVFYVLIDWHPMLAKIDGWLPRNQAPSIRMLAYEMNEAISAFIRGQGTVCIILGIYYAVALSALGLNYALLVGLGTGIFAFIPFVGWALGLITALSIAVVQYWPETLPILLVAAIFLGGMSIDAGFLSPKIVGSRIGLHPVWLIFSLFVFSYLFGFVGTLVAVPLAAAIAVLVRFALKVYLESPVYRGTDQIPQVPRSMPALTAQDHP